MKCSGSSPAGKPCKNAAKRFWVGRSLNTIGGCGRCRHHYLSDAKTKALRDAGRIIVEVESEEAMRLWILKEGL